MAEAYEWDISRFGCRHSILPFFMLRLSVKKEKELGFLFFPFSRHHRLKSTFPFLFFFFALLRLLTMRWRRIRGRQSNVTSGGKTREFFIIAVIKLNEKSELSIFFTKIFLTLHTQDREWGWKKIHFDLFCAFSSFENHDELRSCSSFHTIC